jgi:hypothetical protein
LPNDARKNAAAGPHATRLLLNVLMVEAGTYVCARFALAFRVQPYHIALYRRLSYAGGKVNAIIKKDRRECPSMAEQRGPAAIKEKLNSDPSSGIDGAQRGDVQDKATR